MQQLLWLLEAHTLAQVEPMASAPLWTLEDSNPVALLLYCHPQVATQCQEPGTTCASETQVAEFFAILVAPRGFEPHRAWRLSTHH
jgi:hypothetical protein